MRIRVLRSGASFMFIWMLLVAQLAAAAGGDVDTTFGDANGIGGDSLGSGLDTGVSVVPRAGGGLVLAWSKATSVGVSGFDAAGVMDASFGSSGGSEVAIPSATAVRANDAVVDAQGRILVVGDYQPATLCGFFVARFEAGGAVDTSFSGDGIVQVTFPERDAFGYGVAVRGKNILVVGEAENTAEAFSDIALAQLKPSGALDPEFGKGGRKIIALNDGVVGWDGAWRVARAPRGRWLLTGWAADEAGKYNTLLMRVLASGRLDPDFAGGGVRIFDLRPGGGDYAYGLARDGSKIVLGVGGSSANPMVVRLLGNGTRDTTFGTNGVASFAAPSFGPQAVVVDKQHRVVSVATAPGLWTMRLTANGALDTSYGGDGYASNASTTAQGFDLLLQGNHVVASGGVQDDAAYMTRYLP